MKAQDFPQKFEKEFCTCLSGKTNYTDKIFKNCTYEVMSKLQKDFENFHKSTANKTRDNFMKDLMIRLINNCDPSLFIWLIKENRNGQV